MKKPLLLLFLLAAACRGAPEPETSESGEPNEARHLDAPYVVLVSFDGFRWDYPDLFDTPNFDRVAAAGVRAERMIPVFPTKTFPNHYSIATGMYAETHGLVGNDFWAPDKGAAYRVSDRSIVEDGTWYRGEPIWVTAERQGMRTASYFFVGSEADVGGVRPTHWRRYDASVPNEDRVDQVLDWLAMDESHRPHMITLYFSATDDAGHRHGPESEELREAVESVDEVLGRLLDGIASLPYGEQVYLVLVSDHGMLEAEAELVDVLDVGLFPGVRLGATGPYANLYIDEGGPARATSIRDSLRSMMPENEVHLRSEMPERFHYSADPRIGDIVIVAAPGRTVVTPDRVPTRSSWTHGWDNTLLEMGSIFFAMGPGIQAGQIIDPVESIHVYPMMAKMLGLTPNPEIDGDVAVLGGLIGGD